MSIESWDVDQAVCRGPWDADLGGRVSSGRYGVTADEELAGEPLTVALAQEDPERDRSRDDDEWTLVEEDWDFQPVFTPVDVSPEEAALHLEVP